MRSRREMSEAARLVTAEEFARMPEDDLDRYELIEGRLVPMSPVNFDHGRVVARLLFLLQRHLQGTPAGVVTTEVGFKLASNPDTVRGPDVAFIKTDRLPARGTRGFLEDPPDAVIEVLSPDDRPSEMRCKVSEYLAKGVPLVIVIDPGKEAVTCHRPDASPAMLRAADDLLDPAVGRVVVEERVVPVARHAGFHPIPWGTDGTFTPHVFIADAPASVYAYNSVSRRLYNVPALRRRYHARLRELLGSVFNEDRIVSRLRGLTERTGGNRAALSATEAFIRGRRAAIEKELAGNGGSGPEVTGRTFDIPTTCREPVAASGTIDFTWNDNPQAFQPVADPAAVKFDIPLPGGPVQFAQVTQLATINAERQVQMGVAGLDITRKAIVFVGIVMPPERFKVGEVPFHGVETMGIVIQVGGVGTGTPLAMLGGGSVTLTEVSRENGGRVRGHWQGFVAPVPTPQP